jgi:hypothetical protein
VKISEVIERLEQIKSQHGDVPCGIYDADTGWHLLLNDSTYNTAICYDERGAVVFAVAYGEEPLFETLAE